MPAATANSSIPAYLIPEMYSEGSSWQVRTVDEVHMLPLRREIHLEGKPLGGSTGNQKMRVEYGDLLQTSC